MKRIQKYAPLAIILIIILGLVLWYMTTHPAPSHSGTTATSTAQTSGTSVVASKPVHITEHAAYYDIDMQYPDSVPFAASAGATASDNAVEVMKNFNQTTIDAFKENGNFANLTPADAHIQGLDQGRQYSLSTEYKTYTSPQTISYVFVIYEDTLGAHPNAYYRTFTFNLKTGAGLALDDLFLPGSNFLEKISALSRATLPKIIAQHAGSDVASVDTDYMNQGTTPDEDNFQNFYLDGNNVVFVFPPYQVGAYALGTIVLPIPRTQLKDMLKAEYQ